MAYCSLAKQWSLSAPALQENRAGITGNSGFLLKIVIYLVMLGLGCSMWDLAPRPGIEPGPPALGAQSSSHWTTREVPELPIFFKRKIVAFIAQIHMGHQQAPPTTSTTPPSTPHLGPVAALTTGCWPPFLQANHLAHGTRGPQSHPDPRPQPRLLLVAQVGVRLGNPGSALASHKPRPVVTSEHCFLVCKGEQ